MSIIPHWYVHNGWSCDLGIFGGPGVNFYRLESSNLVCGETLGAHVIYVPGFAKFQYVYFSELLRFF